MGGRKMFQLDSQEKIVLSKTYSIIGKYFNRAIQQVESGEIILSCAGLSSLIEQYRVSLNALLYEWNLEKRKS